MHYPFRRTKYVGHGFTAIIKSMAYHIPYDWRYVLFSSIPMEFTAHTKSSSIVFRQQDQQIWLSKLRDGYTVYPTKYAHGFCIAVLCCGYPLTDFPISIRLTSLALWQSDDCPSASKATLMNMDKYFIWIHYERLHNHNKAKHNKTVCIFLGIYCSSGNEKRILPLVQNVVTPTKGILLTRYTVYPKKYAHGFVVLCFVVVM